MGTSGNPARWGRCSSTLAHALRTGEKRQRAARRLRLRLSSRGVDCRKAELLENDLVSLPLLPKTDLLESSSAQTLRFDLDWARECSLMLDGASDEPNDPRLLATIDRSGLTAHQLGYSSAHDFRQRFHMPLRPLPDLDVLIHQKCGWPSDPEILLRGRFDSSRLTMVGKDKNGYPRKLTNDGIGRIQAQT